MTSYDTWKATEPEEEPRLCVECGHHEVYSRDAGWNCERCDEREDAMIADGKTEYFEFLDELRKSAVTNMWGAAPYLIERFPDLDASTARAVLVEWMRTFSARHPR